jgi:AcrR family transcriptional regulator
VTVGTDWLTRRGVHHTQESSGEIDRGPPASRRRPPVTLHGVAAQKPPATRLSVDDWLQAGYTLLAEQGVRALKVESLCQQVGATRGSFYWHFEDMDGYRAALVASWNTFLERDRRSLAERDALPPRERLSTMMIALTSPQHWVLERAMREWARTDSVAAANIRAADRSLLRAVTKAYGDYGFSPADAKLRAELTFAAGIGLLHLAGSAAQAAKAAQRERFLDFMLADPT